ncbi:diacylglycerol kinase family protein [Apibacter sp. HY039]|uniref:diacylglycerol/lipid kinase family protein n=1 Tax=Apibacter sp. HY039 TaxID=2501476 RepID=UPI000FEBF32B|nr:diacylglycerol kinase family protein [Apibacter sp. HY039]
MKVKKIHFIVNPISGGGKGKEVEKSIRKLFYDYNIEIKLTEKKNDAHDFAIKSYNEGADLIVSCGGDGTFNEVASALVNKDIPLAIVPIGSGNGLARHLKLPLNYEKALQLILNSKMIIEKIDVGCLNEYFFFSNTGIGFDAEAVKVYSNQKQRQLIGYLKCVFLSIFQFKPVHLILNSDVFNFEGKAMLLNISNSNCMGYDFTIAPQASLKDGLLDVNLVKKCSWFKFLSIGLGFVVKKNFSKKQSYFKTNHLNVKTSSNGFIQLDGEYMALDTQELKISILPQALNILVS